MATKRIKVGQEFDCLPAVNNGWLSVEKGKHASVCFDKKRKRLSLVTYSGETYASNRKRPQRKTFPVEEYEKVNAIARELNKVADQAGSKIGALNSIEIIALNKWRDYQQECANAGVEARRLDEIIQEVIERERGFVQTPSFAQVAVQFLEHKEALKSWVDNCRIRNHKRIEKLTKAPSFLDKDGKSKSMSDISTRDCDNAIRESISSRIAPEKISKVTFTQWQTFIKAIFDWWYELENSDRPQSAQLKNPLRNYTIAPIKNMDEPKIISVKTARALLKDLWENDQEAIPAVTIRLFAAVRSSEVARLKWKDLKDEVVYLPKSITKGKVARNIPIQKNLSAWLNAFKLNNGIPQPDDYVIGVKVDKKLEPYLKDRRRETFIRHALERSCKRTGLEIPKNAIRHTAVSAMCARFDEFKAASWSGHSHQTQGEFYKSAMSPKEVDAFFLIAPPATDGKAIPFDPSYDENKAGKKVGLLC